MFWSAICVMNLFDHFHVYSGFHTSLTCDFHSSFHESHSILYGRGLSLLQGRKHFMVSMNECNQVYQIYDNDLSAIKVLTSESNKFNRSVNIDWVQ